jgi:RimJ/RimL family protein N-acetyltransferase
MGPADALGIWQSYAQDPEVTRYLTWRPHEDLHETERHVERCIEQWDQGTELTWIIAPPSDDQVLGSIALRPHGHMADIGYVLARSEWGKGYMTEAVRAVIDRAFSLPEVYRVWATCDVENVGSARVMEKAGMTKEGTLRRYANHPNMSDEPRSAYCYAIVR